MRQRGDEGDGGGTSASTVAPGEQLRRLRQARGISLAGLSDLVHYTKGYLSRVETGEKPMTPEVARRCEGALRAAGELSRLVSEADRGRRGARGTPLEVCPYRGLAAFGVAEAGWFFGRERATAALVNRLTERLDGSGPTAVVAASGTGKSSLLQAGLVPALRRGVLPVSGSSRWPVVTVRPGAQPVDTLLAEVAHASATDAGHLRRALDQGPAALARAVHEALQTSRRTPGRTAGTAGTAGRDTAEPVRLVLVVDQFEEVFTLCADAHEQAEFVRAVHGLATGPAFAGGRDGSAALVVLGMRADFYGRCLAFPELAAALRDGQLPLEPMRAEELREAVVRPARAVGLDLEPGLVELILRDLGAEHRGEGHGGYGPGTLPLLSHALLATWQRRREGALTVEGYQQACGIAGAVAATAERAYARLSPARQEAARSVLLGLVRVDEDGRATRGRVAREPLARQAGACRGAALDVVEEFARARLLTVDADEVALAHEAVLHAWPRLHGWIETHAATLHARQQLGVAARQWDAEGRDPALLPRGSRLEAARDLLAHPLGTVSEVEQAYVAAAVEHAAAERAAERRRTLVLHRLLATLAVLLVLAVAGGALAAHQGRRAVAERGAARSAELAFRSTALSAARPEVSMLLATAAWRQAHTPAAAGAVLSSQAQSYAGRLTGHRGPVLAVAWQPRPGRLLSAGADGTVRQWDGTASRRSKVVAEGRTAVRALAVARRGPLAAWGDDAGTVTLWDAATSRLAPVARGGAHHGAVRAVALSDHAEVLASAGRDGTVRLSRPGGTATEAAAGSAGAGAESFDAGLGPLYAVAVTGDGSRVAAAGLDGRVWLRDVRTRRSRIVGTKGHGQIHSLAFSPDGRHLATGEWNEDVGLWNTATGEREAALEGLQDSVLAVAFSPDGKRLAAAGQDDTASVWDLSGRRRTAVLASHLGPVHGIAFSPDGRRLATAGEDGTLRLWTPRAGADAGPATAWLDAALSPDRAVLAVAGQDGTVRLWGTRRRGVRVLRVSDRPVRAVAFSQDGSLIAAGDGRGTATVWRAASPDRPVHRWQAHPRAVTSVAFRPGDPSSLATAGEDGTARLWRTAGATPHLEQRLLGHEDAVYRVLFLDGATLATGSQDNTARIWRASDGRELRKLADHADTVLGLAVSPAGTTLATASRDYTVKLWDPRDGRRLRTLAGHTGPVTSAAFDPGGSRMVTTGRDNTVRVWDPREGRLLLTLTGHTGRVRAAAFLGEGGPVVSVAEDATVRRWNLGVDAVLAGACEAVGGVDERTWRRLLPDVPYVPGCP
ncbi:helix-turn-helix domain-containing protein [Streptomyces sp. NPDC046261]|uniref:nSTAND1 domain-containing NTPase n=1 Tax=Streptomyces sp. NPDC046261 TaxID=3157200 RepID=UPI00340B264D